MACEVCGKVGGHECPTCKGDFCYMHYLDRVRPFVPDRFRTEKPRINEQGMCTRCGSYI